MNQQQRHFYLSAMGITLWQQRGKENYHNHTSHTIPHDEITKHKHSGNNTKDTKNITIKKDEDETETSVPSHTSKIASQTAKSNHANTSMDSSIHSSIDYATLDWVKLKPAIETCQQCTLTKSRNQAIIGIGKHTASLMIIGDAPADDEDRQGLPFAGKTEQLLSNMLNAIDLKTHDVYITNLVKCRPPNNRTPKKNEFNQCNGFMQQQIKLIQPDLILVVGRVAAQYLLNSKKSLTKLRNAIHVLPSHNIPVIATYHPDYLLRQTSTKAKTWEDLKKVRQQLTHLSQHH